MKLFIYQTILIALCAIGIKTYAGHENGGLLITYENVGHITGDSLDYVLSAYGVYDTQGISAPSTTTVGLSSSCNPNSSYNLPLVGGISGLIPIQGVDYCVSSPGSSFMRVAIYRDTITLPGLCSDYVFFQQGSSLRFFYVDNISNPSSSTYFFSRLNNTKGPNSSPKFEISDLLNAVCTNKPVVLFGFNDTDKNDSIYYSLSSPMQINNGNLSNIPYNTGYSKTNQVGTTSGLFKLDSLTGELTTEMSNPGVFVVTIKYEEYRYDSIIMAYNLIGLSRYTLNVVASGNCTTKPFNLEHTPGQNTDSLDCLESTIRLAATRKLTKSTLSSSGSEFNVHSMQNGIIPVNSAAILNDSIIELQLANPVPPGDALYVTADSGTDGNVIFSVCGNELAANNDTVWFYSRSGTLPQASFTYNLNFDTLQVNATASSGASLFFWDFGDGDTASGPTAQHIYSMAGNYNVSLIILNSCGITDTFTTAIQVIPCDTPRASWTYNIISTSSNGMQVQFDGTTSSAASSFEWDFGDGNTDNSSLSPVHTYTTPALTYRVSLTVYNDCNDSDNMTYRLNEIGLKELNAVEEIKLFPNPASTHLQMKWGNTFEPKSISISSIDGRQLLEKEILNHEASSKELRVRVDYFESGVYILKIESEKRSFSKRFIIKR